MYLTVHGVGYPVKIQGFPISKQETSKKPARFWQGYCDILKSRKEKIYVDDYSN